MPFAALTGYERLVHEQEIAHEPKRMLTDEHIARISDQLTQLHTGDTVRIEHYTQGRYVTTIGTVRSLDSAFHTLELSVPTQRADQHISFENIWDVSSTMETDEQDR